MRLAVVAQANIPLTFGGKIMSDAKFIHGKVFVVTHIKPSISLPEGYEYISVGEKNLSLRLSDKSGDSIAHLNRFFSELTAIYWIWKNYRCDPDDFVGVMHYRRVLSHGMISKFTKKPIDAHTISKILSNVDVIVPEAHHLSPNVYENYSQEHESSDLDLVLSIAEAQDHAATSEYLNHLKNTKSAHICNVMICRKSLFDQYCSWLFEILLQSFAIIDFKDRDAYQRRVFGFLSERLFNIWLHEKKLSKKELPMIRTDFSLFKNWNRRRINNRRARS